MSVNPVQLVPETIQIEQRLVQRCSRLNVLNQRTETRSP